jgi:hypothetical protein
MPDITKCLNIRCPNLTCWRLHAPDTTGGRQSYAMFTPDAHGMCPHHMPGIVNGYWQDGKSAKNEERNAPDPAGRAPGLLDICA